MRNKVKSPVKAVGTYLLFSTGFSLDLHNTFYVLDFIRNLVSLHQLDLKEYSFEIGNSSFRIYKNNNFIGNGILFNGLYRVNLDSSFSKSLLALYVDVKVGSKHSCDNETSSVLWHKCLSHISKKILEQLVKDGFLPTLNVIDFGTYIDCIKGK